MLQSRHQVMPSVLVRGADQLGIELNDRQLDAFERYYRLLKTASSRFNLTTVIGYEAVQQRHFLESLALLPPLREIGLLAPGAAEPVLDLGTGAGLPGLPLKIAVPGIDLTLLEATGRKAVFLREVTAELALEGVEVLTGRAEDVARQPGRRAAYHVVVARAVASLPALLELALPFLHIGGVLAAPKGGAARREAERSEKALGLLGGRLLSIDPLRVPGAEHQPWLVLVRKVASTPLTYPRRAGIPSKRSL